MIKNQTIQSLQRHKLAAHKRFGQNFLVNPNTAKSIVNCGDISAEDTIVEVGVGLGALTNHIAEIAAKVIGIEIDSGLIRYHSEEKILSDNIELIHGDILKIDFSEIRNRCGSPLKIMANLPYSISNPFVFTLIQNRHHVDWVVVMLQKEVADRLTAPPSTKQYGIPTVLLNAYASVKKYLLVKPHEFHPQPKVDSLVIGIDFKQQNSQVKEFSDSDHLLFQKIVRAAFAKRRKTLLNNLVSLNFSDGEHDPKSAKNTAAEILTAASIRSNERAENLSLSDYINLTKAAASHLQP